MGAVSPQKRRNISGLIGKAVILASVAAVLLPLPRYAQTLGQDEYVIWLARLAWVLLLTLGICGALALAGIIARKMQDRHAKPKV